MWLDSDFNWIWERFEHGQKVFSVMKILKICGMILEWNILLIDTELLLKLWRIGLWKENALHKLLSCKTWSMLLYVDWSEWIRNREFGRYHDVPYLIINDSKTYVKFVFVVTKNCSSIEIIFRTYSFSEFRPYFVLKYRWFNNE